MDSICIKYDTEIPFALSTDTIIQFQGMCMT